MAWKILGRRLESSLRAADVFFALTADKRPASSPLKRQDFVGLQQARQNLALFQHHDDITGTSTDHNMRDLATRLAESIESTQAALAHAAWIALTSNAAAASYSTGSRAGEQSAKEALVATVIPDSMNVGVKSVLVNVVTDGVFDGSALVILTNPLPSIREEVIQLRVNSPHVRVVEPSAPIHGDPRRRSSVMMLPHQIDPVWSNGHHHISTGVFSLLFRVKVGAFQIKRVVIEATLPPASSLAPEISEISVIQFQAYGSRGRPPPPLRSQHFHVHDEAKENLVVSNECLAAVFDAATTGHLNRVVKANGTEGGHSTTKARVEFLAYNSDRSGAYLFIPDGQARQLGPPTKTIVVSGPVQTEVRVIYPWAEHVVAIVAGRRLHSVLEGDDDDDDVGGIVKDPVSRVLSRLRLSSSRCKSSSLLDSLRITNHVNLKNAVPNNELIMRIRTDIRSDDLFYTDSNAFEMVKRKRFDKLPIQGNYYPMPLAAYIEDGDGGAASSQRRRRMTLLAAQPQGVSSLSSGVVEVMQDRMLINDDYRGLGQGVLDNKLSVLRYVLLFEEESGGAVGALPAPVLPHLSLTAHQLALRLNQPVDSFTQSPDYRVDLPADFLPVQVDFLAKPFPCDIELMSLRPMPNLEENASDADKLLPSKNGSSLLILNR